MCFRQWTLRIDILCSFAPLQRLHVKLVACRWKDACEFNINPSCSHSRCLEVKLLCRDVITRPGAPSFTGTSDLIYRTEYCSKLNWNKLLRKFNCFKILFTLFPHIRKIGNTTSCVKRYVTTPWRLFPIAFVCYMKNVLRSLFLFVDYFVTSVATPQRRVVGWLVHNNWKGCGMKQSCWNWGTAPAFGAQRCKPEGRWFESRRCQQMLSWRCRTMALVSTQRLRNEYQGCLLGEGGKGGPTTTPPFFFLIMKERNDNFDLPFPTLNWLIKPQCKNKSGGLPHIMKAV
jgi:hypothetical protein